MPTQWIHLMFLLQLLKELTACSPYCACLWKNGKQTVECRKKNLSEIPDGLDPATQVLDFSGNKLEIIYKDTFRKKQLVNIQRLYLENSKIRSIDMEAFEGLTNLVELDLTNNLLEIVPTETLRRCLNLMKLTLSSNPISILKKGAFEGLAQLNSLELSNCNISEIQEGAFQGLHRLEWLRLDGNRLKTIPGRHTLPDYVKGIELEKNMWECDCHIHDLSMWLSSFNYLLSVEPICQGPPRLAGHSIKSIPISELGCLPKTSPTSFYLELGEGKNVSLMCHIHAIPEASVSWYFQGQILQNDTIIAPGVHLIYFVEEGGENKRSELFIYNANTDDNGTFICNAENIAGVSQSNFTIKIILKENPIVIIVSFPFEYVMIAIIGISLLAVSVLIALIALIIKCRMRNRRKEKMSQIAENSATQFRQDGSKFGEDVKESSDRFKQINTENQIENITTFEIPTCELSSAALSPGRMHHQIRELDSLNDLRLKQNPDIINGCRREGDGQDHQNLETYDTEFIQPLQIPIARLRESTEFLDGNRCIVDPEGYPIDYGLPKLPQTRPSPQQQFNEAYYRTLPSNRFKRHSAANPFRRISREAEFLSRSVDSPYDNSLDVRYTADGYPARAAFDAATADNMADAISPSSLPYCSGQWQPRVLANMHVLDPNLNPTINPCLNPSLNPNLNPSLNANLNPSLSSHVAYGQQPQNLPKRSASAQTDNNSEEFSSNVTNSEPTENAQNDSMSEILTESPDEGYEGEPSVA